MPGDKLVSYSPEYSLGAGFHMGDEDMRGRCLDYPRDAVRHIPEPTSSRRDGIINADGERFNWGTGWGGTIEEKRDQGAGATSGGQRDEFFFGDCSNAPMASVQYQLDEITRERELRDSLSISGTASIKGGFASAKGSFTRNKLNTKDFQYFLLSIKIRTRVQRLDVHKVTFDPEVRAVPGWLTDAARREFHERFGDSFISGVVYGGEFQALFSIDRKEVSAEDAFDFSAQVKIGPFSGEFGAASRLAEASRNKMVQVQLLQVGGEQTVPVAKMTDPVQCMEMARAFPASVLKAGGVDAPVRVVVTPYAHLPDYDGPPPPAPRLDLGVQEALADQHAHFSTLLKDLLALGRDPKFVSYLSPGRAGALSESQRKAELASLRQHTLTAERACQSIARLLVSPKRTDGAAGGEGAGGGPRYLEQLVPTPPAVLRLWLDRVEGLAGISV